MTVLLDTGLVRVSGPNVSVVMGETIAALSNGAALFESSADGSRAVLLNGGEVRIQSGDGERVLYRPGFQVVSNDGQLSSASRVSREALVDAILRLSEGLRTGQRPDVLSALESLGSDVPGLDVEDPELLAALDPADEFAVADLQAYNNIPETAKDDAPDSPPPGQPTNTPTTVQPPTVVQPPPVIQPPVTTPPIVLVGGSLGGLGGLTPSVGSRARIPEPVSSATVDENRTFIRQDFADQEPQDPANGGRFDVRANMGPTTNRLFFSGQSLAPRLDFPGEWFTGLEDSVIGGFGSGSGGVGYYFGSTSDGLVFEEATPPSNIERGAVRFGKLAGVGIDRTLGSTSGQEMARVVARVGISETYSVRRERDFVNRAGDPIDLIIARADTIFSDKVILSYEDNPSNDGTTRIWSSGRGAVSRNLSFGTEFQEPPPYGDDGKVNRRDHFLLMDMRIVDAVNWVAPSCIDSQCREQFDAALETTAPGEILVKVFSQQDEFTSDAASGAALISRNDDQRYVFAAGGLDEALLSDNPGRVIDRFHLSAGMEGPVADPSNYAGISVNPISGKAVGGISLSPGMHLGDGSRAFLRSESWTDLAPGLGTADLVDTPLSIVYPGVSLLGENASRPKLIYADFGMKEVDDVWVSTLSLTLGEVEFRKSEEPGENSAIGHDFGVDALISGSTIGSSRGKNGDFSTASILFKSDIRSTSAGGGNPNLDTNGDGADPGRLGFFVLENAGKIFDDATANANPSGWQLTNGLAPMSGGIEAPLGGTIGTFSDLSVRQDSSRDGKIIEDRNFGLLRLGVATGSEAYVASGRGLTGVEGFAAGILDVEGPADQATGLRPVSIGFLGAPTGGGNITDSNLSFSGFNSADNSFRATLAGVDLGGPGGFSTYLDDKSYGAVGDALGLVSGELVVEGIPFGEVMNDQAAAVEVKSRMKSYKHTQWGLFMGDTQPTTGGGRQHAHMGSYAAGRFLSPEDGKAIVDAAAANPSQVSVTFNGHAIGNVTSGGRVYTSVGSYSDNFSFASRTGTVAMNFDNRALSGATAAPADLQAYNGTLNGAGLNGALNGRFIGPAVRSGGVLSPAGVVGAFSVSDGSSYSAVGTFAGEVPIDP